jgi:Fe-S-cluster-containing hydrogenase component 2
MLEKTMRKIIQVDEEKCNGCGVCIDSCAEGALALVNGKAKLVKDQYCDGLAACLKECPQNALHIIERDAAEFDEEAVKNYLEQKIKGKPETSCACPGSAVREFSAQSTKATTPMSSRSESELTHWPVQLTLVPAGARFLNGADVLLIAHCVPFAYPNLHQDFLKNHAVLTACPKLDDAEAHLAKLTEVLRKSNLKSLSVLRMEVPCCSGLTYIAKKALAESGVDLPLQEIVIGIDGQVK